MRIRRQSVEHPFGTLKSGMDAVHFFTGTLDRVSTEMSLHVLAYNFKRVLMTVSVSSGDVHRRNDRYTPLAPRRHRNYQSLGALGDCCRRYGRSAKPALGGCKQSVHEPGVQHALPLGTLVHARGDRAGSASSQTGDRSAGVAHKLRSPVGRDVRNSIRQARRHVRHRFSLAAATFLRTTP